MSSSPNRDERREALYNALLSIKGANGKPLRSHARREALLDVASILGAMGLAAALLYLLSLL